MALFRAMVIGVKIIIILLILIIFSLKNVQNSENSLKNALNRYKVNDAFIWEEKSCYTYTSYDYSIGYFSDMITCRIIEDLIYYEIYGINNSIESIYVRFTQPVALGEFVNLYGKYRLRYPSSYIWSDFMAIPEKLKATHSLFTPIKAIYIYDDF